MSSPNVSVQLRYICTHGVSRAGRVVTAVGYLKGVLLLGSTDLPLFKIVVG